jgi:hypothetical protein
MASLVSGRYNNMRISARNTLKGKIKNVQHGAVNTEVVIELVGGTEGAERSRLPASDDPIEMTVENEGESIPSELRQRVFDKFFRAIRDGDVSTKKPTGTGMVWRLQRELSKLTRARFGLRRVIVARAREFSLPCLSEMRILSRNRRTLLLWRSCR